MAPGPITEFLTSTNAPIFPSAPKTVPGRINAYGPTVALSKISAEETCDLEIVTPWPIKLSVIVVSGPIVAEVPT